MKRLRMLVASIAMIVLLVASAVHVYGQTEETDANGVPTNLYPQGYLESAQAKNSLKNKKVMAANDIDPGGSPAIPAAQPNGQVQGPPPEYEVIDLGSFGTGQSYALAINNNGQVVGYASLINGGGVRHAFFWSPGTSMQDLGTLSGGNESFAYGINDAGQIVGSSIVANGGGSYAFLYSNGHMTDMNGLLQSGSGWILSGAAAINNAGQVAGNGINQAASGHAFVYSLSSGSIQDVGSLDGGFTQATAINGNGHVTGSSTVNDQYQDQKAYVYRGGPLTELDALSTLRPFCVGYSINNSDQVVGLSPVTLNSNPFATAAKAILWEADGSMLNLGTLQNTNDNYDSSAYGINDSGQIVGLSDYFTPNGDIPHAFIYQGNVMYDLNDYLSENPGWVLTQANAINNKGQIVGYGTNPQGQIHAFLLNPVPPCTALNPVGYKQASTSSAVPTHFGKENTLTSKYGCALCSAAAMLSTFSGFESMTPAQLDSLLIAPGKNGYNEGDNLNWFAFPDITGNRIHCIDSHSIPNNLAALNAYLEEQHCSKSHRVIVHLNAYLDGDSQRYGHFILVTGKNGSDWNVFDPGWSHAWVGGTSDDDVLKSLAGHLTAVGFTTHDSSGNNLNWKFEIEGVRTFVDDVTIGSANYGAHSPVELLVTDPDGKRVGYDPTIGSNVFEIPGSSYFSDNPIVDVETGTNGAGDPSGIKTLIVPFPVGGNYQVQLFGTGSGGYTIDLGTAWPDGGGQAMQTFTGTASPGVLTTNQFFVIGQPVISGCSIAGNAFNFTFTGQSNVTYSLQGRTALESGSWTNLQTSLQATNGIGAISQPITADKMFYRIVAQ